MRKLESICITLFCVASASPVGAQGLKLERIADTIVEGGVEIVLYDPSHDRVHAIGASGRMVVGFDDSTRAEVLRTVTFSETQEWEATSIALDPAGRGFGVVSWVPNPPDSVPGMVQVIDLATGDPVWQFTIGFHPDCLMFSPDGRFLYAANEGEPHSTDHLGAITVADLRGIGASEDFAGFNSVRTYPIDDLNLGEGVRLDGLRITPEHQDYPGVNIEPEYIAASNDGAWVSLQENNGLAYFDIEQRKWTRVIPLAPLSFAFDASETDGVRLHSGEGFGLLALPDTIALYEQHGRSYIVTANEGEKTAGHELRIGEAIEAGLIDPARVAKLDRDFGDLESSGVDRLIISSIDGDIDGDGDLDVLCPQGGRSVSIIDADTGIVIWNSGPQIELLTGMLFPDHYNACDSRSDRAGPEPEGIALKTHGGRTLMAVGLERTNAVMLYDVSNPYAPAFLDAVALSSECQGPEGLTIFEREQRLFLAVASEEGGCLTIYEIADREERKRNPLPLGTGP